MQNDVRFQQLNQWVAQQTTMNHLELKSISGDASFRRYFRWPSQPSYIAVDSPPDKEDLTLFVRMRQCFSKAAIRLPEIQAYDEALGFMLLSDFGDNLLLAGLNEHNANELYKKALVDLVKIQSGCRRASDFPLYDKNKLHMEMELFTEWLLKKQLNMTLSSDEQQLLDSLFSQLIDNACAQTFVAVHRDYHSRNLMILDDDTLGIIDFQDAVWGPIMYDVVSLLKDCYIGWTRAQQLQWLQMYALLAKEHNMSLPEESQLIQDFDWMGIQRHLKAAGIFVRLYHRDGKSHYLPSIPQTLTYIVQTLSSYDDFQEIHHWFETALRPQLEKHRMMWLTEQ